MAEDFAIDSAGGVAEYTSPENADVNASLTFPPGAVPDGTTITVALTHTLDADLSVIPGLSFKLKPDGIIFTNPVTVVVNYDETQLGGTPEVDLKLRKKSGDAWQALPTTVDTVANTLTATLSGFSSMFVSPPDTTEPVTTATPAGTSATSGLSVELSCTDTGGWGCYHTYYTTDGSTPSLASPVYAAPVAVGNGTTVLNFFSTDRAENQEAVRTESYTVTIPTYTIGGTVTGDALTGNLTLRNGGATIVLGALGEFTFSTIHTDGTAYDVTVVTAPAGQNCQVTGGSGSIAGADVSNIVVNCLTIPTYSVGGTVSGLTDGTVVLQVNGAGDVSRGANGVFTFPSVFLNLAGYNVSVKTHPTGQTCTVVNGNGIIGSNDITNVVVS